MAAIDDPHAAASRDAGPPPIRPPLPPPEPPQPTDRRSRRGGLVKIVAAIVVIAALGAALRFTYELGIERGMGMAPQLIKTDLRPTKVAPDSPGGMYIPHQDKLVYDAISSGRAEVREESLAAPPEEPVAKPLGEAATPVAPPAAAGVATGSSAVSSSETLPVVAGLPPPLALVHRIGSAEDSRPARADDRPVPAVPQAPALAAAAPAAGTTATPAQAGGRAHRIQIGAYRSAENAEAGWRSLRATHKDLLEGLDRTVVRIDLGTGKGVFHRLQAGPLPDAGSAQALCARFNARKQGCLIVRP